MSQQLTLQETVELHELLTFQSNCLIQLKMFVRKVIDYELHDLYLYSIRLVEKNIRDLLPYVSNASNDDQYSKTESLFFAGNILGAAKNMIKMYASAITIAVSPELRSVFHRHLNIVISWYTKIFDYMTNHKLYPVDNLHKLLDSDLEHAKHALLMKY